MGGDLPPAACAPPLTSSGIEQESGVGSSEADVTLPLIEIIAEEVKDESSTVRADSVFDAELKVGGDDTESVTTEYRTVISGRHRC